VLANGWQLNDALAGHRRFRRHALNFGTLRKTLLLSKTRDIPSSAAISFASLSLFDPMSPLCCFTGKVERPRNP
jgi:hypothetical protein